MYRCESWTIKEAECQRTDAFKLWCWRRLLRVPWTSMRSNQSILKEISALNIHWKDWCWSWSSNTLATWCKEPTHWKRLKAGEGDDRGWDGWMASLIQWMWVWANSKRYWRTGKLGVLQSMQSQRVEHGWAAEQQQGRVRGMEKRWRKDIRCTDNDWFSSVQFSHSVMSDSLQPHELQHARPPCPSPTPRVHPNPCPLSQWCHPTISSSVVPVSSCPQSFPASGSFQMSQLFASGGQSIGVSASKSVLQMNTQDWSPLGWTDWISLQSKGLSRVFSNTTVQKHQFFSTQLSL